MPSHFLYSTNSLMKKLINEQYRNNLHYVWCGENFDAHLLAKHSASSLVAPSSNPADIYRDLKAAVQGGDLHCPKIKEQRASLIKLAVEWASRGEISEQDKIDITFMLKNFDINHWKPILYVIPRALIDITRLDIVPMNKRASFATEYIIKDLTADEFDLIEF